MVGVALFCGTGIPACPSRAASFPCPARRPHPRTPASNTLVVLTKTSPVLHGNVAFRQYLRFQRMNPMKRTIATMPKPRYTYHPCSTVAETTAPRAESTSNRAALPFISRFCSTTRASLLAAVRPCIAPALFLSLSPRQLSRQVHHLAHMMIRMPRTTNENLHSIRGFRLALGSVRLSPVLRPLFSYRRHHHGAGAVQCAQGLLFAWRLFIRKLPFAVPHISGFRHARPNVVVQISGQVQHQVPNAISVRIRLAPEPFIRKRVHRLVQLGRNIFVIRRQPISHRFVQFGHESRTRNADNSPSPQNVKDFALAQPDSPGLIRPRWKDETGRLRKHRAENLREKL